jgi:hypothetical protein
MPEISDAQREHFREQGYVVLPGVLTDEQLATGRRIVATMLERKPPEGVGAHFLWPRFGDDGHPLLDFYREAVDRWREVVTDPLVEFRA